MSDEFTFRIDPDDLSLARTRWERAVELFHRQAERLERLDQQRHERYGHGNEPSTVREKKA